MALTITKTGSSKDVERRLLENVENVGRKAGQNAQEYVPVDKGDLRDSLKQGMEGDTFVNTWSAKVSYSRGIFDYAYLRYYKNEKNPDKTRWFEKDMKRNGDTYLKEIGDLGD